MQLDATLNLVWAVLGLFALAATGRVALRQNARERSPRWLLVISLIFIALFPYISASDDILRLGHAHDGISHDAGMGASLQNGSHRQEQNDRRHQSDDLLRLYESLDTPLACRLVGITFQFLVIAYVMATTCARANRVAPQIAGRSPPVLAAP